jgi:hypothetical protein
MNKKILFGILAVALIAGSAAAAVISDTWLDTYITLSMRTGSLQAMAVYEDCAGTLVATSHDFGVVSQGNTYEYTVYVLNTGSQAMNITYLPTTYSSGGGQVNIGILVDVIEYGAPCQMSGAIQSPKPLPWALPEKVAANPGLGFPLMPTKMIKLDIKVTIYAVQVGGSYAIPFEIAGVA